MPGSRDHNRRLLSFARRMRHEQTDTERKMWMLLRDRRLSGFKFRRQHPIAGYIVDFFCISAKLVVELDGGQHTVPAAVEYDARRTAILNERGIRALRFDDQEVLRDADLVFETIYNAIVLENPSPQPSPGIPGEGERRVSL